MVKFKLKINETTDLSLLFYSDTFEEPTFKMVVESDSLDEVDSKLKNITKLQILTSEDELLKQTTKYKVVESTTKVPTGTYLEESGQNIPAVEVVLKEADLDGRISDLEDEVFTTIDVDSMSLEEYKEYKKMLISIACNEQIENGVDVETAEGIKEHFTYYSEDQINFIDMNNMVEAGFDILPYHSNHKDDSAITSPCKMYSATVIRTIYMNQLMNKFILTTKCNHLYQWIDGLDNKSAIEKISWDSELIEPYKSQYETIVQGVQEKISDANLSKTITQAIKEAVTEQLQTAKTEMEQTLADFKETATEEITNAVKEQINTAVSTSVDSKIGETVPTAVETAVSDKFTSESENIKASVTEAVVSQLDVDSKVSNAVDTKCTELQNTVNTYIDGKYEEFTGAVATVNNFTSIIDSLTKSVNTKLDEVDEALADLKEQATPEA